MKILHTCSRIWSNELEHRCTYWILQHGFRALGRKFNKTFKHVEQKCLQ